MAETTIKAFATQIGVPPDRLLQQLVSAGISGKNVDDSLTDDEKMTLLGYLRTHHGSEGGSTRITLKHKSVSQIKQATRTGPARTVQVEVRKKRTFVKRTTIEEEQAAVQAAVEAQAVTEAPVELPAVSEIVHPEAKPEPVVQATVGASVAEDRMPAAPKPGDAKRPPAGARPGFGRPKKGGWKERRDRQEPEPVTGGRRHLGEPEAEELLGPEHAHVQAGLVAQRDDGRSFGGGVGIRDVRGRRLARVRHPVHVRGRPPGRQRSLALVGRRRRAVRG